MWGCPEVLQVLLASGGNPWLVDCFDMNAFNYALKEDQEECYKMLRACCNSQPKPSSHSKSPYHLNLSELQRLILALHTPNSLKQYFRKRPPFSQNTLLRSTAMLLNPDLTPSLCLTIAVTPYIPVHTTVESVCASLSNCLTVFFQT